LNWFFDKRSAKGRLVGIMPLLMLIWVQKYKIVLELTNFNPKRSADFVDSIIIRIFAENFELWQERPNKSL
jgi:hypothetical protein